MRISTTHFVAKVLAVTIGMALTVLGSAVYAQTGLQSSGLVGKLEGATIVTDPAAQPKEFKEAPQLAELVKAGKLPPVKDRVPAEPLVLKPVHSVGNYGGTWRRGFTGPGDNENGNRINASDRPMLVDHTGAKPMPSLAKG